MIGARLTQLLTALYTSLLFATCILLLSPASSTATTINLRSAPPLPATPTSDSLAGVDSSSSSLSDKRYWLAFEVEAGYGRMVDFSNAHPPPDTVPFRQGDYAELLGARLTLYHRNLGVGVSVEEALKKAGPPDSLGRSFDADFGNAQLSLHWRAERLLDALTLEPRLAFGWWWETARTFLDDDHNLYSASVNKCGYSVGLSSELRLARHVVARPLFAINRYGPIDRRLNCDFFLVGNPFPLSSHPPGEATGRLLLGLHWTWKSESRVDFMVVFGLGGFVPL